MLRKHAAGRRQRGLRAEKNKPQTNDTTRARTACRSVSELESVHSLFAVYRGKAAQHPPAVQSVVVRPSSNRRPFPYNSSTYIRSTSVHERRSIVYMHSDNFNWGFSGTRNGFNTYMQTSTVVPLVYSRKSRERTSVSTTPQCTLRSKARQKTLKKCHLGACCPPECPQIIIENSYTRFNNELAWASIPSVDDGCPYCLQIRISYSPSHTCDR